ncbi:Protein tyrosine phosphatase type IVA 2 [Lemmus lemmus]
MNCLAELGSAPMLVALALIEFGMSYEDAIQFGDKKSTGALNSKQLLYLENTDQRCDYASEIPMDIAVFSRSRGRLTGSRH